MDSLGYEVNRRGIGDVGKLPRVFKNDGAHHLLRIQPMDSESRGKWAIQQPLIFPRVDGTAITKAPMNAL